MVEQLNEVFLKAGITFERITLLPDLRELLARFNLVERNTVQA